MLSVGDWQGMNKRKKENVIFLPDALDNIITEMSNLLCAFQWTKAQKLKDKPKQKYVFHGKMMFSMILFLNTLVSQQTVPSNKH